MADPRPKNSGQISTNLPGVTTYLTGHNAQGKAIVEATRPGNWNAFDDKTMAFNQIFTTSFPADLNNSKDIEAHDDLIKAGTLGLAKKGGIVCRQVSLDVNHLPLFIRYVRIVTRG